MQLDSSVTTITSNSASASPAPQAVRLLGARLDSTTEQQCIGLVLDSLDKGRGGWIVTHNLDHLRRLTLDGAFRSICEQADIRVADGMPLVWASRIQGTPLPERVAGSSLIWTLTAAAAVRRKSIFLLGGDGQSSRRAAEALQNRWANLKIAGVDPAPVGFDQDPVHMEQLRQGLIAAHPDIVFVALGSPKQEQLINELRGTLPKAWWIGVGISFSFVCGEVKRAPNWAQRAGLEWVHRMAQEPGRLWRRYLCQGIPFAARLFVSAALNRFAVRTDS